MIVQTCYMTPLMSRLIPRKEGVKAWRELVKVMDGPLNNLLKWTVILRSRRISLLYEKILFQLSGRLIERGRRVGGKSRGS